jgi:hypothetical protein|tara:strand:- start:701 stop:1312 length:612 start_codon:yes stop_codon:yes gene_type:complete
MKSLSEIETTSKRASRAIGFSWGVAEEVAKNIRLLELFGLPGIKNLNQYYKLIDKKKFENLSNIKKNNKPDKYSLCPIGLGVNVLDQIKSLEPLKKITFQKIAYPILFLPFLSRCSDIIGKKILFKFEKNIFLLNFNLNILSNFLNKELPSIAKKAEVSFLENKDSFIEKEWQQLYKLSENTFVEESESLKQGAAGAGLTDND